MLWFDYYDFIFLGICIVVVEKIEIKSLVDVFIGVIDKLFSELFVKIIVVFFS